YFRRGRGDDSAEKFVGEVPGSAGTGWEAVKVPHDWDREGPFLEGNKSGESGGYAPAGIGWYWRTLHLPEGHRGRKVFLAFDGVYMRATVYLGGREVGHHLYGYSPFVLDITEHFHFGRDNALLVKVDNSKQPNCRWYSGSGIYRTVRLVSTNRVHVPLGGVFVHAEPVARGAAPVHVLVEVHNETDRNRDIVVRASVLDGGGSQEAAGSATACCAAGGTVAVPLELELDSSRAWSVDDPHLYELRVELVSGGITTDATSTVFGVRAARFNRRGFHLNGEAVLLKGVNLHHDGGCVGSAVPERVWERRLKVLKSMGCNAIRTAHNPPAAEFLDLCDRLGFLVIDEAFDSWTIRKKRHDWVRYGFRRDWERELTSIVRRDRNHPCVVLWSLGNEIRQFHTKRVKRWHVKMCGVVKGLDPTRPVTAVLTPGTTIRELKRKKPPFYGDIADVICTNYTEAYLPDFHERWPDKAAISAEAYHYWRRKGPRETHLPSKPKYPDYTSRNPWFDVVEYDFLAGLFLWTGIEYLGEVRDPYPYHGRTNAPVRINGFKKPQARFHESLWSGDPVVRLVVLDEAADIPRGKVHFDFPKVVAHWNFGDHPDPDERRVFAYTNCDSVELFLNGHSLGEKDRADFPLNDMSWLVGFELGKIEAVGRVSGETVARDQLLTAGPPARLEATPDVGVIRADGWDCANVEVRVVDAAGVLVPDANHRLRVTVDGPGTLLGLDGGDLASHDSYLGPECNAYWGEALAVVQSTGERGEVAVRVEVPGNGIEGATARFRAE
ncbi:MAG: glycoside hydrolase family 2 TIM barrel-domain containing protein, partial [Promethearchaeota archaeon]